MNGAAGNGDDRELLWPQEVANLCGVGVRTVTRWARQGQIEYVRTPGGRRRYRAAEVRGVFELAVVAVLPAGGGWCWRASLWLCAVFPAVVPVCTAVMR